MSLKKYLTSCKGQAVVEYILIFSIIAIVIIAVFWSNSGTFGPRSAFKPEAMNLANTINDAVDEAIDELNPQKELD